MLEQNHDFNALLINYEKYNKTITNYYLNNNRMNSNGNIKIPRKRFTDLRKQEIREHCMLTKNYAETANTSSLNVRSIVKSNILDVKLSDKGTILELVDCLRRMYRMSRPLVDHLLRV